MRINNNMMAMNTHRQLSLNTNYGAKSIEKLSSGYRINRAGDDAAGLAISEKMRGQIRGLTQASRNAQDDISLIQTTEGALNETHAIIQRMREMAVQSANDTNTDDDRSALQNEMNQLAQEVTRIANTTEFNTRQLLNGNLNKEVENATGDLTFHIGANMDQNMKFSVKAMDAFSLGLTENIPASNKAPAKVTVAGITVTAPDVDNGADGNGYTVRVNHGTVTGGGATSKAVIDHNKKLIVIDTVAAGTAPVDGGITEIGQVKGKSFKFAFGAASTGDGSGVTVGGSSKEAEVLSSAASFAAGGGVTEAKVAKGIDISSQKTANVAIKAIDNALKKVSDQRAELGAVQNRLEHTIKNVDTSAENLQASESRIRDVDMAKEMMNFTKNNILQQAAQAMLAQANQAPQGVLQLLR